MPKIERKLVELVERHMYLLCGLFSILVALYLRRPAVWWVYEEITSYFNMHDNYTQTVTYYLVVRLLQYLPALPVHSVKWVAGMADFGVAALVTYLLGKEANSAKRLIFFVAALFSPVMFLRGITWGQLDSVTLLLLLAGYGFYSGEILKSFKGRKWLALFLLVLAVALSPWIFGIVLIYLWRKEERQLRFWKYLLGLIAGVIAIQFVGTVVLQISWKESLLSLVRFLIYHPESGNRYDNVAEWLLQLFCLCGSTVSTLTLLAAGRRKFPYVWAIVIQVIAAVLCGGWLFREII